MHQSTWLQKGFSLNDQNRISKCLHVSEKWQLYSTYDDGYALAVVPELVDTWAANGIINANLFNEIICKSKRVSLLVVPYGNLVSSVEFGPYPETSSEAEAFAIALANARKQFPETSFSTALYLERENVLLPMFDDRGDMDDGRVLGRWLTQGVGISIKNYERACQLLTWMHPSEVAHISSLAGFEVDATSFDQATTVDDAVSQVKSEKKVDSAGSIDKKDPFILPGRPELEAFFNDYVIDIVLNAAAYKRMGVDSPSGIILYGPPGCGKTYAVERLVEYLGWPDYRIDSSTIGSKYIHETSKKISEVFDSAIDNAPSIIIIDEMEAFLTDRARTASESGHIEEVAEFLRRIPEALGKGVLIIAMTNMIESIDPAIRRRGRFDHMIKVDMPSAEDVYSLLTHITESIPLSKDVDLKLLAAELAGHPMSDVTFVIKEAGRLAVKNQSEEINDNIIKTAMNALPKQEKKRRIGFSATLEE